MRNFRNVRASAQAESARRQSDLELKLAQMTQASQDKKANREIQVRQFICAECGLLTDYCQCKPNAPDSREAHLLYGAEKMEYIRDQATHKSGDKKDLPHEAAKPLAKSKSVKSAKVKSVKPKVIAGGVQSAPEIQKNAADAKKREAVDNVRKELTAKAKQTETRLDDMFARHTEKSAKAISFETAPSALEAGIMTRDYVSGLINDAEDAPDFLF